MGKEAPVNEKPDVVKTHLRNMVVVPEMTGSIVGVYNGKVFTQVEIKPEMYPARSPCALRTALMSPDTSAWTTPEMRGCWRKPRGSLSGFGIGATSAFGSRAVLNGSTLETAPVKRLRTDWMI